MHPELKDIPDELLELLKINISVNSSYTSKLVSVNNIMIIIVI